MDCRANRLSVRCGQDGGCGSCHPWPNRIIEVHERLDLTNRRPPRAKGQSAQHYAPFLGCAVINPWCIVHGHCSNSLAIVPVVSGLLSTTGSGNRAGGSGLTVHQSVTTLPPCLRRCRPPTPDRSPTPPAPARPKSCKEAPVRLVPSVIGPIVVVFGGPVTPRCGCQTSRNAVVRTPSVHLPAVP